MSENLTDSSYGAKRWQRRWQDVWVGPCDTNIGFPTRPTVGGSVQALCWGRFLLKGENQPPNSHSLTSNTPTNSPDQLGTVILLIMKFSTPDFGPRAVVRYVKVSHVFGGTGNREYIYITSTTKHFYQSTYLGSPVVVTRTTGHPTRTRDKVSLSDIRYPVSVCLSVRVLIDS